MTISWDAVDWPLALLLIYLLLPLLAVTAIYSSEKDLNKKKGYLKLLLSTVMFCLFFSSLMLGMLIYPALGPWEEAAKGVYDRVEYTDTRVKKVPVGWRTVHKTIIYFTDGRTYMVPGEYDLEFEKGTAIKILTKNHHYKIERATP